MKRLPRIFILPGLAAAILLGACSKPSPEPAPETHEDMTSAAGPATERCVVTPPKETFACTMDYRPVCGCDKKTYSNACMAKAAGVTDVSPGACESDQN